MSEDSFKIRISFPSDELFKKDDLQNIFSKKMSDALKTIGLDNIPEEYKEAVEKN